jgi:hypothetical protein
MVVTLKRSTKPYSQERLAKEDIDLLIAALAYCAYGRIPPESSHTRLEMLIEKLKRMKSK